MNNQSPIGLFDSGVGGTSIWHEVHRLLPHENTVYFRRELGKLGFDVPESAHPIVPVMLYDARVAQEFAARMLEKGVYVVGFCYPVVPMGKARIRTQVSAGHTKADLDFAIRCFAEVKKEMGL